MQSSHCGNLIAGLIRTVTVSRVRQISHEPHTVKFQMDKAFPSRAQNGEMISNHEPTHSVYLLCFQWTDLRVLSIFNHESIVVE